MISTGMALLILVLVFGGVAGVLLYALMVISHEQDHEARKMERSINPLSEVTITRF
jgi:heme/copper-type cytochrome/quinol oxidase subunit 2